MQQDKEFKTAAELAPAMLKLLLAKNAAAARRKKKVIPAESRRALALRHDCPPGGTVAAYCAQCQERGSIWWSKTMKGKPAGWVCFGGLEIDHIHPESKGGASTPENLQLLCRRCNRRKGAK